MTGLSGTGKRSRPRQPDTPPPPHVFMHEPVQQGIANEAQEATAPASAGGQKGDTDADDHTIRAADYEAIIENLYRQNKVYRELVELLDKTKTVTMDKSTQTDDIKQEELDDAETTGKRRKLQWRDNEA